MNYLAIFLLLPIIFFLPRESEARKRYLDLSDTLCEAGETVYISCSLDVVGSTLDYRGPVASVCAKGNTSPDAGYVQYRYGTPGVGVDVAFPDKKVPPRGLVKIYNHNTNLGASLRFHDGSHTYSFESAGLAGMKFIVKDRMGEIVNKWCDAPGVTYIADSAYTGIEKNQSETGP